VTAPEGAALDEFGLSVAINGSTVVVGSQFDATTIFQQGSVYVFTSDGFTFSGFFSPADNPLMVNEVNAGRSRRAVAGPPERPVYSTLRRLGQDPSTALGAADGGHGVAGRVEKHAVEHRLEQVFVDKGCARRGLTVPTKLPPGSTRWCTMENVNSRRPVRSHAP
jgi:hypothetical protein